MNTRLKILIGLLILSVITAISCAEYKVTEAESLSDGAVVCEVCDDPVTCEPCEECGECGECMECEECEECETCPEPPQSDPCECFQHESAFERQKCITQMMRDQGMCTQTPGQHWDVRVYCKVNGYWISEKTWVYPCDEPYWWEDQ